jgi:hypothetical protein
LVPVLDILVPSIRSVNCEMSNMTRLDRMEVERIFAQEIRRARLVESVTLGAEPADLEVRGRVEFLTVGGADRGLGILAIIIDMAVPRKIFREHQTAKAHLELWAIGHSTAILARDYATERRGRHTALSQDPVDRAWGEELVPQIVAQFISDLRALPPDAWSPLPIGRRQ